MGEPNTFPAHIKLDRESGVVHFMVGTEGLGIHFDIDIDDIDGVINKLRHLQESYHDPQSSAERIYREGK